MGTCGNATGKGCKRNMLFWDKYKTSNKVKNTYFGAKSVNYSNNISNHCQQEIYSYDIITHESFHNCKMKDKKQKNDGFGTL